MTQRGNIICPPVRMEMSSSAILIWQICSLNERSHSSHLLSRPPLSPLHLLVACCFCSYSWGINTGTWCNPLYEMGIFSRASRAALQHHLWEHLSPHRLVSVWKRSRLGGGGGERRDKKEWQKERQWSKGRTKKKEISFQALSETAHLNCTVAVHRGRGSAPRELQ